MKEIIRKSVGASLLISLGVYVNLKLNNEVGTFLFSFGLLGVCYLNLNLFTGKCGFVIENKTKLKDIAMMLIVNIITAYLFGILFAYIDNSLIDVAGNKIASWNMNFEYFIKSILCGAIMYIAVYTYKKGSNLGIILGIPLFIFCGFQHCIANAVTSGIANNFRIEIILSIIGNWIGSLLMYFLSKGDIKYEKSK